MPTLRVDFQEGFTGQEAVVRVDGRERFRAHVKTRLQTGLAALVNLSDLAGPVSVDVELPSTGTVHRVDIPLNEDTYLCVTREPDGALTHALVFDPPGYL